MSGDLQWTFIQYASVPKLGIYPEGHSTETPLGIYGFPADGSLEKHEEWGGQSGRILFDSRRYVVKYMVKPEYRSKILTFGGNGETEFFMSPELLLDKIDQVFASEPYYLSRQQGEWRMQKRDLKEMRGLLYENVYTGLRKACRGERETGITLSRILRSIGIEGIVDHGSGTVYNQSEPFQAVFFSIRPLELLSIDDQHRTHVQRTKKISSTIRKRFENLSIPMKMDAEDGNPRGFYSYNSAWVLQADLNDLEVEFAHDSSSDKWNVYVVLKSPREMHHGFDSNMIQAWKIAAEKARNSTREEASNRQITWSREAILAIDQMASGL